LRFLETRDADRPFFVHMSFSRPHAPVTPSPQHFDMYDPEQISLPASAVDYYERGFQGKPSFVREKLDWATDRHRVASPDPKGLKRWLASYYALITVIDHEIGRVLDCLERTGQLENTVVVYHSDHGDFAGEHGLRNKAVGMYESIHRVPFLLSWPDGPQGTTCSEIVELVDLYPTLSALCDVPLPDGREGIDLTPVARGEATGKGAAFCELAPRTGKESAIRTSDFRLIYYSGYREGELYDRGADPGELSNLWGDSAYSEVQMDLLGQLLSFSLQYAVKTGANSERSLRQDVRYAASELLFHAGCAWSELKRAYGESDE
jgi:arylsulfatase A-like enzyme